MALLTTSRELCDYGGARNNIQQHNVYAKELSDLLARFIRGRIVQSRRMLLGHDLWERKAVMTEVSVLIPAKDEALNIRNCLDAVFSQATDVEFEVILVDSGSTDGTPDIVSGYPVRLYRIAPEEFHHARTRNYLASLARGKHLIYLNADAFPASPDWLNSLISNFSDPYVGAVYGRHLPKPNCDLERQVVLATMYGDERIVKEPSRKRELGYRYYHLSTVNAAVRKDVWESVVSLSGRAEDLRGCRHR